jgi:Rrf2 family protein
MKISAKIEYACRALLELSLHWPSQDPLPVMIIARRQRIPLKFLTQILLNLKQAALVSSLRGNTGGYLLAKPPADINLCDVMRAYGELGAKGPSSRSANVILAIWEELDNHIIKVASEVSFDQVVRRHKELTKIPMYTI